VNLSPVIEDLHTEDSSRIRSGKRRSNRTRPGRDNEVIEALPHLAPFGDRPSAYAVSIQIDRDHLMLGASVDRITVSKLFRRPGHEPVQVGDHAPNVVRDAAGGVRRKPTALESDDLEVIRGSPATGLGCRAHPRRVTPYYDKSLAQARPPSRVCCISVSGRREP
jgi:hypothetical protein